MLQYIKGLKYPDEYFIKFFFKHGFHTQKSKLFLELGCSNGCNLMLPYEFEHSILGVDLDTTSIQYAKDNFKLLNKPVEYKFYNQDMREFCNTSLHVQADVLVLANSIYYILKDDFMQMLKNIKNNHLIKPNTPFFIRFRDIDDFRNNKGKNLGDNSVIMQNKITGEDGFFCKFYTIKEMVEILKKWLNLRDFETMSIKYENIQNGTKVNNSDVVIWGVVN